MRFPLSIKDIKHWAKSKFKDVDLLTSGFALDHITVTIKGDYMNVADFDEKPPHRLKEATFYTPESYNELIKKLVHHCGETKISARLKPNITLVVKN